MLVVTRLVCMARCVMSLVFCLFFQFYEAENKNQVLCKLHADISFLALIHTPAYPARPQMWAGTSCGCVSSFHCVLLLGETTSGQ